MNDIITPVRAEACAVLTLVLKGKWYDMIASGAKWEEYRLFKLYWHTRIANWRSKNMACVVEFRRGYAKNAPRMSFLVVSVDRRISCSGHPKHPEWGEPKFVPYYAIELGKRVELTHNMEAYYESK